MTYPQRLSATVTINGVDVTDYVDPQNGVKIDNVLTRKTDTCKLTLERASAVTPEAWDEIVVLDGADRIFGGFILSTGDTEGADLDIDYEISASDYSSRLGKVIVKEEYENMTDAEILDALFTEYLAGEGFNATTYVTELANHTRMRFNRISLLKCVEKLAKLGDGDFYIDYNKNLHYFVADTDTVDAPYALSDNPDLSTSMPYDNFQVDREGSEIVNRVEVVGGNYRSEDALFYLPGTGEDNRIILPFKMHAPDGETSILVYRNDGTQATPSWTAMTVKAGYIETLAGANECLYYYQEKVIEQTSNFPNLPNALKIEAKYEVPLRTRVVDQASIDHYGKIFDAVIVDKSITDKPTARLAALARLAEDSFEKSTITLDTRQPGLRAGQVVSVVNSIHGINGSYLIQKVATKVSTYGKAVHSINLGTYNSDFIDLMIKLANATDETEWREDEVLDELLQRVETLSFAETTDVTTSTGPYYFSETPANAFIWGFGTFQP